MTVVEGAVGVSGPPEVDPVIIQLRAERQSEQSKRRSLFYLVICDKNHAGSEVALQTAIWKPMDLVLHTIVAANKDCRRSPPLGHGQD